MDSEQQLLLAARTKPEAREELRARMRDLAERLATLYPGSNAEVLVEAGMADFDRALQMYLEKTDPPYKFSTYFTWWITKRMEAEGARGTRNSRVD